MVSRTSRSAPLVLLGIVALIFAFCFGISAVISTNEQNNSQSAPSNTEPTPDEAPKPDFIDLQPTLDEWISSTSGNKGVAIYDLDNERISASYRPGTTFATASLYKLFPVYQGYIEVEQETLNPLKTLANGYTVSKCLDLAIRESNSACAELLMNVIGAKTIQNATESWGATNTDVADLSSTPNDIVKVLQKYYQHSELSPETYGKILDSMLDQPPTRSSLCGGYCDWRQGLPSGFSDKSKVYNKVGWEYSPNGYWNLYHDAAIVEIPSSLADTPHHYAVVVMTSKINPTKISALGAEIEKKVLDSAHN